VALRQTELKLISADADATEAPLREAAPPVAQADHPSESSPTISGRSLVFKEHLERLSEVMLVLLIGGMLFVDSWNWRAVSLALFLFVVVRPASVLLGLAATRTSWRIRNMVSWFGVRGIGSLYYLMFAIQHGLPEPLALELIELTLVTVALSIFVHGTSVKPLMDRFWKTRRLRPGR
jgi:NhaP-type Na+/H+ or K+/H+ antiporter